MDIELELRALRREVRSQRRARYLFLAAGLLLGVPLWLQASQVPALTIFANDRVADAAAVNANFAALRVGVNDTDTKVATLRTDVDTLPPRPQYVVVWQDGNAGVDGTDVCVAAGYTGCAWEIRLDTNPIQLANCTDEWECPNAAGAATNCRLAVCTR